MVHTAPHTQVSLRCIETETGRVIAMVNTTFNAHTPVAVIAADIVRSLSPKIETHFRTASETSAPKE